MHLPEGFAVVTPYLLVSNGEDYVSFLQRAFGASEVGRSMMPGGRIANCQMRIGTATFMLSDANEQFPPSSAALYLYVADADATMRAAVEAGAAKIMDVSNMPYGDRQGGVRDPSGNIWWISQRLTADPYYP